jgi:hypothetical protein
MSGVVKGDLYIFPNHRVDVVPIMCPQRGIHRVDMPICYTVLHDGGRRACPFWQATVREANPCERIDASFEAGVMHAQAVSARRVAVLCTAMRKNVRPGT